MLATAARLATAMSVNLDIGRASESFFDQQMRRRLWFSICHLDTHLAVDRGSETLHASKQHPELPLNVNDDDFGPHTRHGECKAREGFTEMSLIIIHHRLQTIGNVHKRLLESPPGNEGATSDGAALAIQQVESAVRDLQRDCDPNSSSYAWLVYHGASSILAGVKLYLRRPIKPTMIVPVISETDPPNVLRLAVTVLEHEIVKRTDPRGEPFRWFGMLQWHPLAVAIVECYACENTTLLQHVWPTIETSFDYHSGVLAQYKQGVLVKPLERLMTETRARVKSMFAQREDIVHAQSTQSLRAATSPQVGAPYPATTYIATPDSLADYNTHMTFPPDTGAVQTDSWLMESSFDESLWDLTTPSMWELGRETWDEFMSGINFDAAVDVAPEPL